MPIIETPYWWETDDLNFSSYFLKDNNIRNTYDLAIVGGGFTGLSAAITASKIGAKVLVIDKAIPGQGASTRNGGMLGAPHKISFIETVKTYGEELARELLHEGVEGYNFTKDLLTNEYVDSEFSNYGRLRLAWSSQDFIQLKRDVEEAKRIANYNVNIIDKKDLHYHIGSKKYFGAALFKDHGGLNPMKFHNSLMQNAIRLGVDFLVNTSVKKIYSNGSQKLLVMEKNEIATKKILLATNGYTTSNFNYIKNRIFPVPSFIISTEPLNRQLIKALAPGKHMMVETRSRACYFRISSDGTRLLFGGRAALHMINNKKASVVLRNLMVDIFPDLQDVKITHCWSGWTGFTFSKLPHVGIYNNLNFALGYSGNGVALSPYLGHKAALQTLGHEKGQTAFSKTKFESRFYYYGKPWFLKFASYYYRIKDFCENKKRTIN